MKRATVGLTVLGYLGLLLAAAAGGAVMTTLSAAIGEGPTPAVGGGVVRASAFEVVDSAGKIRARLGVKGTAVGNQEWVELLLFDAAGKARAELRSNAFGGEPVLKLHGSAGLVSAKLGVGMHAPGLKLHDYANGTSASLGLDSVLLLEDALGSTLMAPTQLQVSDAAGITRAWLGVGPGGLLSKETGGEATLVLWDSAGKGRAVR